MTLRSRFFHYYVPAGALCITLAFDSLAGVSEVKVLTGKVWSFDQDAVVVCEKKSLCWDVPREYFRKDSDLRSDIIVSVQVPSKKLRPHKTR